MSTLLPPQVITTTLQRGQGIAGPPGPAGPASGAGADYTAAVSLSGHRVLALDSLGQAVYASADTLSDALRVAGMSLNAASAAAPITVQSSGLIEFNGWAWTANQPVYLGLGGAPVQTLPVGAVFAQVIGKAISPTQLMLSLQPPIIL